MTSDSRLGQLDENELVKDLGELEKGIAEIKGRQFIGRQQVKTYKNPVSRHITFQRDSSGAETVLSSSAVDPDAQWNVLLTTVDQGTIQFDHQTITLRFFPDHQRTPLVFAYADHYVNTPGVRWTFSDWVNYKLFGGYNDYWDTLFGPYPPYYKDPQFVIDNVFDELGYSGFFERDWGIWCLHHGGIKNYIKPFILSTDSGRAEWWEEV